MEKWLNKVALVSGASSGIGAAVALALANNGVRVVGISRRDHSIRVLKEQVTGTGDIIALKCDMREEDQILKVFQYIKSNLKRLDILVNSAGFIATGKQPDTLIGGSTEAWKTVLDVNVLALTICCREAISIMRTCGDCGHIININSVSGHVVPFFASMPQGMYSPSKFAVTALTESLRVELIGVKSKIKITSISPGSTNTEMSRKFEELDRANTLKVNNDAEYFRKMDPEDIAEAVLYVLATKPNVQVHELMLQPIGQKLSD